MSSFPCKVRIGNCIRTYVMTSKLRSFRNLSRMVIQLQKQVRKKVFMLLYELICCRLFQNGSSETNCRAKLNKYVTSTLFKGYLSLDLFYPYPDTWCVFFARTIFTLILVNLFILVCNFPIDLLYLLPCLFICLSFLCACWWRAS